MRSSRSGDGRAASRAGVQRVRQTLLRVHRSCLICSRRRPSARCNRDLAVPSGMPSAAAASGSSRSAEEAEGEDGSIVGRQPVEGRHQLEPVGRMHGGFEPGHIGREVEVDLANAGPPPRLIEGRSNGQPSEPGRPVLCLTQAPDVSPGSKEGFLHGVLRFGRRAHDRQRQAVGGRGFGMDQRRERGRVSRSGRENHVSCDGRHAPSLAARWHAGRSHADAVELAVRPARRSPTMAHRGRDSFPGNCPPRGRRMGGGGSIPTDVRSTGQESRFRQVRGHAAAASGPAAAAGLPPNPRPPLLSEAARFPSSTPGGRVGRGLLAQRIDQRPLRGRHHARLSVDRPPRCPSRAPRAVPFAVPHAWQTYLQETRPGPAGPRRSRRRKRVRAGRCLGQCRFARLVGAGSADRAVRRHRPVREQPHTADDRHRLAGAFWYALGTYIVEVHTS